MGTFSASFQCHSKSLGSGNPLESTPKNIIQKFARWNSKPAAARIWDTHSNARVFGGSSTTTGTSETHQSNWNQQRYCFCIPSIQQLDATSCHFASLPVTVTVTSSLKLSPWCFCYFKCSALYALFVEQCSSNKASYYHDQLRCKALQSLQIECIDISQVEKITGNSTTSTRKMMTWNMSAWL